MECMTEDCIYEASSGIYPYGTRFEGAQAVKDSFLNIFKVFPDAQWNNDRHIVDGERGMSQWFFTGTLKDGSKVKVHGCDLFHFKDGKIYIKDSYRKNR
jgi:ketosteroid isomerase-like protein